MKANNLMEHSNLEVTFRPHPFQSIGLIKFGALYFLAWLLITFIFQGIGISVETDPLKAPLMALQMMLLDYSLNFLFIRYLWQRLKHAGLTVSEFWGATPNMKQGELALIVLLQLVMGVSALFFVTILWPESKQIFRPSPTLISYPFDIQSTQKLHFIIYNVMVTLIITVIAPFFEEIIFRGWILHRLIVFFRNKTKTYFWPILFSAILFGSLHGQHMIGATCFGLILNIVYLKYKSLRLNILIHAIYNVCVTVINLVLFTFGVERYSASLESLFWWYSGALVIALPIYVWHIKQIWPKGRISLPLLPLGFSNLDAYEQSCIESSKENPQTISLGKVLSSFFISVIIIALINGPIQSILKIQFHIIEVNLFNETVRYLLIISFMILLLISMRLILRPWPLHLKFKVNFSLPQQGFIAFLSVFLLLFAIRWGAYHLDFYILPLNFDSKNWYFSDWNVNYALLLVILNLFCCFIVGIVEHIFREVLVNNNQFRLNVLCAVLIGIILHNESSLLVILISYWLMKLAQNSEQKNRILSAQFTYNLIVLAVQLIPLQLLIPLFQNSLFNIIAIPIWLVSLYKICQITFKKELIHRTESTSDSPEIKECA